MNSQVRNATIGSQVPKPSIDFTLEDEKVFGKESVTPELLKNHVHKLTEPKNVASHKDITPALLNQVKEIDFREIAGLEEDEKIKENHLQVISIETILELAKENRWGICRNNGVVYLYNGAYWTAFDKEELKVFLGQASQRMGVDEFKAKFYKFRDGLFKQFLALSNMPKPETPKNVVLINLKNGTFQVSPEKQTLRRHSSSDFITYQLPFAYDETAKAPQFESFLNEVLPDESCQRVLAEYIGYLLISSSTLKLEKTLLLYGSGANGKSVFFEIINALLGEENVSSYSLSSLTDREGYFRAKLADKLVNYASEINGKLEASVFKQLVSNEPVEARLPYGEPFILRDYAKLIFNCNGLPTDVEHTNAYFRRFIIIPFMVTIPPEKQDKGLAGRIIKSELPGVFNWALEGLQRLLKQQKFSPCPLVDEQVRQYRESADSVQSFLKEESYVPSEQFSIPLKNLYAEYRHFCDESGYKACSNKTFGDRLRSAGLDIQRKKSGRVVFVEKSDEPPF